jgi:RimJ/RimL family protein N-acetyltransferase
MPVLVSPALPADLLSRVDQPTLLADGIVLRPWQPRDADVVMTAFALADIQRWHMRRVDSHEEAIGWIDGWASRWRANTDGSWAITRPSNDVVLGCASLRTLLPPAATAQISYWTLPAARGAGVATAGARAVTQWAFETLGLNRVYVIHSVANIASCRVAGGAGFALEGTLRSYMLHVDGWHDVHMHARVATDSA